jgi:hypothetical protein
MTKEDNVQDVDNSHEPCDFSMTQHRVEKTSMGCWVVKCPAKGAIGVHPTRREAREALAKHLGLW